MLPRAVLDPSAQQTVRDPTKLRSGGAPEVPRPLQHFLDLEPGEENDVPIRTQEGRRLIMLRATPISAGDLLPEQE